MEFGDFGTFTEREAVNEGTLSLIATCDTRGVGDIAIIGRNDKLSWEIFDLVLSSLSAAGVALPPAGVNEGASTWRLLFLAAHEISMLLHVNGLRNLLILCLSMFQ